MREIDERDLQHGYADTCDNEITMLKRGNTILIERLMDMVAQHCYTLKDDVFADGALSANEDTFLTLIEAGFAEEFGNSDAHIKLLWDKLETRKKELGL